MFGFFVVGVGFPRVGPSLLVGGVTDYWRSDPVAVFSNQTSQVHDGDDGS